MHQNDTSTVCLSQKESTSRISFNDQMSFFYRARAPLTGTRVLAVFVYLEQLRTVLYRHHLHCILVFWLDYVQSDARTYYS
jgi:hypothetical protein